MVFTDEQRMFGYWIQERHNIYLKKSGSGSGVRPPPWTTDPILAGYRFCNIYRQLDKVTAWMNTNWFAGVPAAALPMRAVVARLINDMSALESLKPSCPAKGIDTLRFVATLNLRKAAGDTIRGHAYIVSTNGRTMPFPEYIVGEVLAPMQAALKPITEFRTLAAYADHLESFMGIGSFIAGQVIADLKYHHPHAKKAPDWSTFVVPGPGSLRGLKRMLGHHHDAPMSRKAFEAHFHMAQRVADSVTYPNDWEPLHAQDVQNCLCEFDKYMRAKLGQGSPKQRYSAS